MAINFFIGWSQKDLEAELRAAQEELAAGKATIAAGSADIRTQSQVEQSVTTRIQMLLQALNALDPAHYPITQVTRSSSVRMVFNSCTPLDPAQDPTQ